MLLKSPINEFAYFNETENAFIVDGSLLNELHVGEWVITIEISFEDPPPYQNFFTNFTLHVQQP